MISPAILDEMLGEWNQHGFALTFAALTAGQDSVDGGWDESTLTEVDADGYQRGLLELTRLTAAVNQDRFNEFGITFGTNREGAEVTVTHVAVLNTGGTSVLTLIELANPVTTGPNQAFVIPTASLRLTAQ